MAYGKIDWSTWTKAAMAKTIDTLTARQTELLNRIAELERSEREQERFERTGLRVEEARTLDDPEPLPYLQLVEEPGDGPYLQLVGRVKRAQPLPTSNEDAYGGPLPFTRVPEAMQKQHEEITRTVTLSELTATQVDWSKP